MEPGKQTKLKKAHELYENVQACFDRTALTLNEMAADYLKTEEKFGTDSKVSKIKRGQLTTVKEFYDATLSYINFLRDQNSQMYNDFKAREFTLMCKVSGLTCGQMARLLNYPNPERWDVSDKLQQVIDNVNRIAKKIDDDGLEQYIKDNKLSA